MTTVIENKREAYVFEPGAAMEVATITLNECIFHVVSGPPADPTNIQTMRLIEESGVLDFWNGEAEDIYNEDDGEPL